MGMAACSNSSSWEVERRTLGASWLARLVKIARLSQNSKPWVQPERDPDSIQKSERDWRRYWHLLWASHMRVHPYTCMPTYKQTHMHATHTRTHKRISNT